MGLSDPGRKGIRLRRRGFELIQHHFHNNTIHTQGGVIMREVIDWLQSNQSAQVRDLANLVAIPSISTDGEHAKEIEQSAAMTCEQMRQVGLQNVEILRADGSYPYAYGEWLGALGKPTVFLYSHHDVQPINYESDWLSPPWTLTERDGRLFGRGAADDKGAIPAQLHAVAAFLKTRGSLPVNVKVLCEGEEEIGSKNLDGFFKSHREKLISDVIVVCDTGNIETGLPCITYSLRGVVAVLVEVQSATKPVHSGEAGGLLADAAIALNVILSRLYWKNGKLPIPGYYDKVRKLTSKERNAFKKLPGNEESWRADLGVLPDVQFAGIKKVNAHEQTWRLPAVTVIAQEASSIKGASNQVLPKAAAIVSCRIVPDQDPEEVLKQLQDYLTKDPPWGVKVTVKQHGSVCNWWMTDPTGPAFEAATKAMKSGFECKAASIGCGGSIGFVGPLAELFGGAPALLMGIEDPKTNAHAPNESLHAGDFRKLTASLAHLFDNLGKLPDGKVKAEPKPMKEEVKQDEPVAASSEVGST
jgi:acetylornithine deacetylase/succinyl-diaminopimelate desuccinylase-like protein